MDASHNMEVKFMLTVRLPAEIEERLNILASATNRPKSFYVREALERSIEDLEDIYLADAAYERFVADGKKSSPLDEVEKRLGLDD